MDKIKAIIALIMIYVILIFIIMPGESFFGQDFEGFLKNDYAHITDMEYKAEVLDEKELGGKVLITEVITFDIHASDKDNPFWELWRDLPESEYDGLKVDYDVLSVYEIKENGSKVKWEESDKLYWYDEDYVSEEYGPGKWYHSKGPYDDYQNFECLLFYIDGIYRDTITFEIKYIMNNAALKYSDVSELYLSMFSGDSTKNLKSFKGQILIQNKDMPEKGNYTISTYGTTKHRFNFNESKTLNNGYHTIYFDLNEEDLKFNSDNNYIEMTLLSYGDDKHSFTNYAPENNESDSKYLQEALNNDKEYDENIKNKIKTKNKIFFYTMLTTIVVLLLTFTKPLILKRKYTIYKSSINPDYFRDIPSDLDPYFAATLVFSKKGKKPDLGDIFSSLMLSLARKGYIELKQIDPNKKWSQNNIEINLLYSPTTISTMSTTNNQTPVTTLKEADLEIRNKNGKVLEKLTENEKEYFNLILKYAVGAKLSMETFQNKISKDYDNTDSFLDKIKKSITDIGVSKNYFQKQDYNDANKEIKGNANVILTIGICVFIFGNLLTYDNNYNFVYGVFTLFGLTSILCSMYLYNLSRKYTLLTQYGEEEYAKWFGLYNFLNSKTLMNEKTVIDVVLWEKYLVYATAFGISQKVIDAFEIICPNIQVTQSIVLSNSYYRSTSFRSYNRSFYRNSYNASNTSRASRYSGGGYYGGGGSFYGGGGRGGGGGGGGH